MRMKALWHTSKSEESLRRPDSPAGRSPAAVRIRLCPAIEGGHIAHAATNRNSGDREWAPYHSQ